ncbi:hypothetical protein HPB47_026339 [Ixodes persulcatus]|uniref:Uncharacterized protein n=1 Tax=Ixodes persulcatus TaxID=34615 RepID=A0AC60Q0T2_IXOPE|nr:hypothetical protein HPB47_026339 [Ixodes persulcatus]
MRVPPPTSGCAGPPVSGEKGILVVEPSPGPLSGPNQPAVKQGPKVTLVARRHPSRFRHDLRLTGSLLSVVLLKMKSEAVVPLPRRRPALFRGSRAHLLLHQRQKMLKA